MSRIINDVENGMPVIYVFDDKSVEIFCDGFGPSMIGFPMVKLILYTQDIPNGPEDTTIKRKVVGRLTVPTSALLQMANSVKQAIDGNTEDMTKAIELTKELILSK